MAAVFKDILAQMDKDIEASAKEEQKAKDDLAARGAISAEDREDAQNGIDAISAELKKLKEQRKEIEKENSKLEKA